MLGTPRIVAFDNEDKDLDALVRGINRAGATCLGFLYTGDLDGMGVIPCPHVRCIFFDLNMVDGTTPTDFKQHYSNIGELLTRVKPKGPYLIILWTHYDERVSELQEFLDQRLGEVTRPFSVAALPKKNYLDDEGNIVGIDKLVEDIRGITQNSPTLAALMDWEDRVFLAASETLKSVTMVGGSSKTSTEQKLDVPRLMAGMAIASAGRENVLANPSRAVSDALLPLLGDHVSTSLSQVESTALWRASLNLDNSVLTEEESGQLNAAIHLAVDVGTQQGAERGAVIPLGDVLSSLGCAFMGLFGIEEAEASKKQFRCRDFPSGDPHWVLVQAQAACDYAQSKPGPLPFYLGLDMLKSASDTGSAPAALWVSPFYRMEGKTRILKVNARFSVSLTAVCAKAVKPCYRLREQALGHLVHHLHSYGSRPGMISLRA